MPRKRAQNEGSIYQRKDGYWVGQVTVEGRKIYKYCKTQKGAREWVKLTQAQVDAGLTFLGAQASLGEYLEYWLTAYRTSVRPKTHLQYGQIVRQHITPSLGKIKLKDLLPSHIQALYNQKLADGSSARTVKLIHGVLHRALNIALKQGLVARNPSDAVTKPKDRRKEMRALNGTQVRSLLLTVRGTRLEALFQLAVTTGLREGELLGLKWSDLDWKNRKIQVQRQVYRLRGNGLIESEPKSTSSRRSVTLGQSTINKLREHLQLQQLERMAMGTRWQEHDYIFPSTVGTAMDCWNLMKQFKKALKLAGLPDVRFHDLRHTAASLLLQQGVHPKVVQEMLGHADISLTLNTYSHVVSSMQEEAADKMDELITLVDVSGELEKIKENRDVYPANPV